LTLIVVPAAFLYIDRFRLWSKAFLSKWLRPKDSGPQDRPAPTVAKH